MAAMLDFQRRTVIRTFMIPKTWDLVAIRYETKGTGIIHTLPVHSELVTAPINTSRFHCYQWQLRCLETYNIHHCIVHHHW